MAKKHDAIIVDIDGTIAHIVAPEGKDPRSPYDYERVHEDAVDEVIRDIVIGAHEQGDRVILVTGRMDDCREVTEEWLLRNNIPYDQLFMRRTGDTRKDSIVKREIYDKYIAKYNKVRYVLDDRNQVVKMWRSIGLKCLQVEEGDF